MTVLHKAGGDQPGRRRPRRSWRTEPPPASIDSFPRGLLADGLPTPLFGVLWQLYSDVLLWVHLEPGVRAECFRPGAEQTHLAWVTDLERMPTALARAIQKLRYVSVAPEMVEAAALAQTVEQVAQWAAGEGYTGTAFNFSELASHLLPDDPDFAFQAGRAARKRAEYNKAEQWFRRTLGLARRALHRPAYIDALLGWGNMEVQRGHFERARELFLKAWRAAKKAKIKELGAAAQHNLLALSAQQYRYDEAHTHALLAVQLYRPKDAGFVYAVHDVAQLWSWQGHYSLALGVFSAVGALLHTPVEQLQVSANIGRAAGGVGNSELFFEAWDKVAGLVRSGGEYVPAAYVNLAEGAFSLGALAQARELAMEGVRQAEIRKEDSERDRAHALLERMRAGEAATPDRPAIEQLHVLAAELVRKLQAVPRPKST
jgi:tetratricopeptide (TPR) repeat protein